MPQEIILPMAALVGWTLIVLTLVPIIRVRAVTSGRAHVKDFRYGESSGVPGDVSLPNRDYMNLLELPVLFYAACLVLLATNRIDPLMITLAWAFVAARIVHSLIHLTYNNVLHRLLAFAAGGFIVLVMWARHVWWVLDKM
jgi:hypothetical protein